MARPNKKDTRHISITLPKRLYNWIEKGRQKPDGDIPRSAYIADKLYKVQEQEKPSGE